MNLRAFAGERGYEYTQLSKWAGDKRFDERALKKNNRIWDVVDPDELERQIAATKAPDRGGPGGSPRIDQPVGKQSNDSAIPTFARSRAMREAYAAKILELDLRQRQGELIEKNKLKLQLAKLHMAVRDNLRTIPDRVASILAAETDQAKIHAIITKEIGRALEGLSASDWS
jgi:hypothetical protein